MPIKPKKPARTRKTLDDALTKAAQQAFDAIRAAHPDETFYGFLLFTTEEGSYVVATALSEEALDRVVDKYQRTGKYPDVARLRSQLRFSAADSPYHEIEPELFEGFEGGAALHEACFTALSRLDEQDCFGKGARRKATIINVVYGDMSDERWLTHAKRLNPAGSIDAVTPYLRLNLPSGHVVQWGGNVYATNAVSLSNDRTVIAYSGSGGDVGVFATATRKPIVSMRRRAEHWACHLSPDGKLLYLGDRDGIYVMNVATKAVRLFAKTPKPARIALSSDGAWLATTDWEGPMKVFDVASAKVSWTAEGIETIAFSADARTLMTIAVRERNGAYEGVLEKRDARNGTVQWDVSIGGAFELALATTRDRVLVASSMAARGPATVRWIALEHGRTASTFATEHAIGALAISPDAKHVAYCTERRLVIADANGKELASGTGGQERLSDCVFLDERRAVAVGRDVNTGPAILELSLRA